MPDPARTSAPAVLAVCGKGGVGKTSISAMITGILAGDPGRRVLAIDADPAVGLATSLGFTPRRTVDDIRGELIARVESGAAGDARAVIERLDYEVAGALEERGRMAFLAIGRPEKDGCYCQVNDFLRDIIASVTRNFDFTVIDGEAGIEQVNRRVMERVTHLVLVSDASVKGINVAGAIHAVAGDAVRFETAGLILNRVRADEEIARLRLPDGIPFLGTVPEDESIRACDIAGGSVLELRGIPAVNAVRRCLAAMGIATPATGGRD